MIEFPEKSVPVLYVPEPLLGFAHGQTSDHPKDGLTLYGPASTPDRAQITIGAIGTKHGLALRTRSVRFWRWGVPPELNGNHSNSMCEFGKN